MGNLKEQHDPESLKNEIKQIVSRISRIDVNELQDHVLIREELGIDSLMSMEIIARLEKALGIKIDETLFASIQSVGDFYDLMDRLMRQKSG
ncbi:MAG: acyl carrier protein [Spirochaetia bacterium]|jgi:acyl carrier protein